MTYPYASNTAVSQYQTRLAALAVQRNEDAITKAAAPAGYQADYDLRSREPDWAKLLNMGAGNAGLSMYSAAHLVEAQQHLQNPEWFTTGGDFHFGRLDQLARVTDELETRSL